MNTPLAIVAPHIGNRTETFVCRHMNELLPGRTAIVVKGIRRDGSAVEWNVMAPTLILSELPRPRFRRQMLEAVGWHFGWRPEDAHVLEIKRFLCRNKVKVLMGEYLDQTLPYISIARDLGIRLYAHAHGYDVSASLRDPACCSRYLEYNNTDGIITMSHFSKQRLVDIGVQSDKIFVVPYGVDAPDLPMKREGSSMEVRCLAVGRLTGKKGPIYLLDAFRRASAVCPNMRLDVIGDGELFDAARQYVDAGALAGKICLHGPKSSSDVALAMKSADIFLQHSRIAPDTGDQEGLPVSILEAMAAALPVVSTYHAGIPEAVTHGVTGLLSPEGDVKSMAEHIIRLAHSADMRCEMGVAAWETVHGEFSSDREREGLLATFGLGNHGYTRG